MNEKRIAEEILKLAKVLAAGSDARTEDTVPKWTMRHREKVHDAYVKTSESLERALKELRELARVSKGINYDFSKGDFDHAVGKEVEKAVRAANRLLARLWASLEDYKTRNLE